MAELKDQIKANPLITLLVLVGLALVGFLIYGLFAGASVTISGILLTIIVLFGLGVLLFIIRGAGDKAVGAEDFIFIVMAAAGVFGLAFLVLNFSPGTFAIYDAPLTEINTLVGGTTNLWLIFAILSAIYLFITKRGRAFVAKYV